MRLHFSRNRRMNVPEASTRKQTPYTRCTSRNLEKACAIFRQVPCIASLSDMIVTSVCSSKGGPRTGLCCTAPLLAVVDGSTFKKQVPENRPSTRVVHQETLRRPVQVSAKCLVRPKKKVDDLLSDGNDVLQAQGRTKAARTVPDKDVCQINR